uniref:Putative exonuclease n=1 Tax=viral metagenome TaxID=1070528 RepID=A0A6M3M502_9ZZZZ
MLTEKQLETHNRCVTGSKIAPILGLSPWKSKWQVFAELHGDIEVEDISTTRMKMGNYAEGMMDEYVKNELGWNIMPGPDEGKFHPDYDFLFGLIDRFRTDETSRPTRIVEYKNVDGFVKKQWDEGPPDHYLCQVHFYSALWDMPAEFFTLFGGNTPEVFEVERDKEIEEYIIDQAVKFWDDLQNDRYPEPDASDSCTQTLQKMFARNDGEMIPGSPEELDHAIAYKKASQEEKEAEERKKLHGNFLRVAIDIKDGIVFPDGSIATWKQSKGSLKFDKVKFEADNPELAQRYYATVPGARRLLVKIKKEAT